MRILLLGEYSNVHATLADGLRRLGHEVVVASNGDSWKDYPRDIDLVRRPGIKGMLSFLFRLFMALPKMRGFDVVQINNPVFVELKAERIFPIYRYLRRNNGKIIMGAFGMDYYWVQVNTELRPMRYSDFNLGNEIRHDQDAENARIGWVGTAKEKLNRFIARDCDAISSCLYEYQVTYEVAEEGAFASKTRYLPLPMKIDEHEHVDRCGESVSDEPCKCRIFVGISRNRSSYKGTDIMLEAAQRVAAAYPERVELLVAEGVPFAQYEQMLHSADILLDQLYSYTPAMNGLLAMSKGIVCVGGGEEEHYELLGETELRPILNVLPNEEDVYHQLELLIQDPKRLDRMKRESIEFVKRHHDYMKVARRFAELYLS